MKLPGASEKEHAINLVRSLLEGVCTGLGSQCAGRERKMVCSAFKNCLTHAHRVMRETIPHQLGFKGVFILGVKFTKH